MAFGLGLWFWLWLRVGVGFGFGFGVAFGFGFCFGLWSLVSGVGFGFGFALCVDIGFGILLASTSAKPRARSLYPRIPNTQSSFFKHVAHTMFFLSVAFRAVVVVAAASQLSFQLSAFSFQHSAPVQPSFGFCVWLWPLALVLVSGWVLGFGCWSLALVLVFGFEFGLWFWLWVWF